MGCETTTTANLFVVRWRAFTDESCGRVVAEIKALHLQHGARVPYLGIMPEAMERTDSQGRKALDKLMNGIEEHCELAAVAIEARGFAGAAFRSMLAGLMIVSGRSGRIKFVDSIDAAMKTLAPLKLPSANDVRTAIAKVGGSWNG